MHRIARTRLFLAAPHAIFFAVLTSLLLSTPVRAQCTPNSTTGCFSGPWDYTCVLSDGCAGGCAVVREISHIALIPTGTYRGQVLICASFSTLFTVGLGNNLVNCTQFFVLDPNSMDGSGRPNVARIDSEILKSEDFTGKGSNQMEGRAAICHDRDGCVVFAGTRSITTGNDYRRSWRFYPMLMGPPAWPQYSTDPCSYGFISSTVNDGAIKLIGPMSIDRREATLTPLPKGDIPSPPPPQYIPSGSSLVLGGWTETPTLPGWNSPALEYWQPLTPIRPNGGVAPGWKQTLGPPVPPQHTTTPHPTPGGAFENYFPQADSFGLFPNVQFNARPQAYPLASRSDQQFHWIKNILVAFDQPGGTSLGFPGESWLIRAPYPGSSASVGGVWELWKSEHALAQARVGGTTILVHDRNNLNRVFVVGGADGTTLGATMQTDVLGFKSDPQTDDPRYGNWMPLTTTTTAQNVIVSTKDSNVVMLPDGNMLIIGGVEDPNTPRFAPLLLGPGGSFHPATTQPDAMAMVNAVNTPFGPIRHARSHNSMAMLLPDGRVILSGGDGYPATLNTTSDSVEIFSPPYLAAGFARPAIIDAPSDVDLNTTSPFEVVVQDEPGPPGQGHPEVILVLIRPGAVTASWDSGNRYIELTKQGGIQGYATGTETYHINVPGDDIVMPGYYMMFAVQVVQNRRIPSVAHWIRFR